MLNLKSVLFLSVSLIFSLTALFAQEEVSPVEFKKVAGGIYEIIGGKGANCGAFICEEGVLMIDAKMDKKSVDETFSKLKEITDKPVKYLVNTHSNGDHIWGNKFFPESVTIIAQERCREEFFHPLWDGSDSEFNKPELQKFVPSISFTEKMNIYIGSKKIQLLYFGVGHTKGDAYVYFPEEKVIFVGDQFFTNRPQLIHSYKNGNSFEYVKTMTKLLENVDAEIFCSGHSEIANREQVQNHINEVKKYQKKVKKMIKDGKTLDEIKNEFKNKNEMRLAESIYSELMK